MTDTQFALQEIAEGTACIDITVGDEIGAATDFLVDGGKDGVHEVEHIDEGYLLRFIAYSKVDVVLYGLCHKEIVFLARSVNARWTEYHVRERLFAFAGKTFGKTVQIVLALELALSVCRVRSRSVGFAHWFIDRFAHGETSHKLWFRLCTGRHVKFVGSNHVLP